MVNITLENMMAALHKCNSQPNVLNDSASVICKSTIPVEIAKDILEVIAGPGDNAYKVEEVGIIISSHLATAFTSGYFFNEANNDSTCNS